MEFERCEIKAKKYWGDKWEFIAEAVGPQGTYIAARTPKFPRSFIPLPFVHGNGEFQDKPFHQEMLSQLVNHLIEVGWEPLTLSGVDWYTRTFQRRVSSDVPDPARSPAVRRGPEDLQGALLAFLNAGTVDESVRLLERSKDVLLTQTAFQVLQKMIEASRKDNPEDVNNLEQKRRLLELARDMKDVQKAGQAMQRHLDEVRDAAVAFMTAKTEALRQVWEQHQKILLTAEGIRRAERLAEQLKERDRSGDTGDPRRYRVREFRVRYLEDARAHGIDYAQRHYYEGLGEIF